MVNVNDFLCKTDSEAFEKAIANKQSDGIILIPPRVSDIEPERDFWLIDRAILLPENTTVIMQNSTIKLSDKCRDNFFRTSNCGMGIEFPEKTSNIHIRGEGKCVLLGADNPRAVGDSSKILKNPCPHLIEDACAMADYIPAERRTPETIDFMDIHGYSYGTDAGKEGESQCGDWRGIGILFANTEIFSIENIRIAEAHGWGISLEACSFGRVSKIHFEAHMCKMIDGFCNNMENEDGVDIRNGCHDILISDITGETGDDVVALTAVAKTDYRPGGSLNNTHVMHNDWSKRDRNIYNITIKNIVATSHCLIVRLLPINTKIWNVIIDGVVDTTPEDKTHWATIGLGDSHYGEPAKDGMKGVIISNVICNANTGIYVDGHISDSLISNVVNSRKSPMFELTKDDWFINVKTEGLVEA